MKKKNIILLGTAIILLIGGSVLGLNSYFGAGGKIPEDTFTRGLVAYWSFDEGTGNTVYDLSGNGNHGTIYGAKWVQGKFGKALSFDGVDDYVDCGDDESLNPGTGSFTISIWVGGYTDTSSNMHTLVAKGDPLDGPSNDGYIIDLRGGKVRVSIGDGTNRAEFSYVGPSLADGGWHHIVLVVDRNTQQMKAFIDGEWTGDTADTSAVGAINPAENLIIGKRSQINSYYLNGTIDEVRIYNRALSEEEIRYHYNHGRPLAHWRFDEGSGTTIYDSSGHGYHGILHK